MICLKKTLILLFIIILTIIVNFVGGTYIFVVDDLAEEPRATEIPRFYFDGDMAEMNEKSDERKISVRYMGSDNEFEAYAKVKIQGNSSVLYEKKNYTIKFYRDKDLDEEYKVDFGWGKQNKYCLKANWIDKTHARNIVTANLVAEIQKKYGLFKNTPHYGTIDGTPVEIYLNDKFLGLYTLNIPKDAWMFDMDEGNENHIVLAGNGISPANLFTGAPDLKAWEVEVGKNNQTTLDKLTRLSEFIRFSSDEDFRSNIEEYFNLDSLLNYYVMLQFAQLVDNVYKNMLLVTYDGKIWYASLYDLDTSWGTQWNGKSKLEYKEATVPGDSKLWQRLEKLFPNELADRYFDLRKDMLTIENIQAKFENFTNTIPIRSFEKEKNRWQNIPGYNLKQINNFLEIRVPLVDAYFKNLYTKEAKVTITYSKNLDNSITVKIKNLRKDIMVLGDEEVTFDKNGKYKFLFMNFAGERTEITVDSREIRKKLEA